MFNKRFWFLGFATICQWNAKAFGIRTSKVSSGRRQPCHAPRDHTICDQTSARLTYANRIRNTLQNQGVGGANNFFCWLATRLVVERVPRKLKQDQHNNPAIMSEVLTIVKMFFFGFAVATAQR